LHEEFLMADLAVDWSRTIQLVLTPWIALMQHAPWVELVVQAFVLLVGVLILHHIGTGALQRIARHLPLSRRLVWYGNRAGSMVVYLLLLQVLLDEVAYSQELLEIELRAMTTTPGR